MSAAQDKHAKPPQMPLDPAMVKALEAFWGALSDALAPALRELYHYAEARGYDRGHSDLQAAVRGKAAPPAWSQARDDLLVDGWVCWVPTAALLAQINAVPGAVVTEDQLAPRAAGLHCERDPAYRRKALELWQDCQQRRMSWDAAIGRIYDFIADADEQKRQRSRAARTIARHSAGLPPVPPS